MISLIHPSRGRPKKSFRNSREWIEKAGCEVELIVSLDISDSESMKYRSFYKNTCTIIENNNTSVVEAANHAAKAAKYDILLYLSDDFKCFDNWGLSVLKEFEGEDRPLLLKADDCLQEFNARVLTIPIMNRKLYERLGYFFHPDYKSMWVDCDLFETVRRLRAMKMCPHLKFEHQHVCVGKAPNDETYKRSSANWDQGKAVFRERQTKKFIA